MPVTSYRARAVEGCSSFALIGGYSSADLSVAKVGPSPSTSVWSIIQQLIDYRITTRLPASQLARFHAGDFLSAQIRPGHSHAGVLGVPSVNLFLYGVTINRYRRVVRYDQLLLTPFRPVLVFVRRALASPGYQRSSRV